MSKWLQQQELILASGSLIRAKLLASLGLQFLTIPSQYDEEALKKKHDSNNILELGFALAQAKALEVSQRYPEHFVIAADQLCVINGTLLDKPLTQQTAIQHLQLLSGNEHQQTACICIARDNKILWHYHDSAYLTMRHLSKEDIKAYLLDEEPYQSCGAYQYETQGKWLFTAVKGNEDTILGLPLLALTNALLDLNVVCFGSQFQQEK